MDRYSLAAIADEAMTSVYQQTSLAHQQNELQERIDAVRNRILQLRTYASERDVRLHEIEEFSSLERVMNEVPTLVSPPEPVAQDVGGGGIVHHHESPSGSGRDAHVGHEFEGSPPSTSSPSSPACDHGGSSSSSVRYSDHFSAFQNLSLGDVLSSSSSASRGLRREVSREDRSVAVRDENRGTRRRPLASHDDHQAMSLGEVLSTSWKPDLRSKIRQSAGDHHHSPSPGAVSRRPNDGDSPEGGLGATMARRGVTESDFGGSLGDILPSRSDSQFRDRRRFFSSSGSHPANIERYDPPVAEGGSRSRGAAEGGGIEREYKNDKSLANRAFCRLHKTKYAETSESKQECSICLENFKFGQWLAFFGTGCKHCFHQTCILEWFKTGDVRCPLCRFDPISGTWSHQ